MNRANPNENYRHPEKWKMRQDERLRWIAVPGATERWWRWSCVFWSTSCSESVHPPARTSSAPIDIQKAGSISRWPIKDDEGTWRNSNLSSGLFNHLEEVSMTRPPAAQNWHENICWQLKLTEEERLSRKKDVSQSETRSFVAGIRSRAYMPITE